MTIAYLVNATTEQGINDAMENGWTQIAFTRFVTPDKHDIRLVRRSSDLIPMAHKTFMLKGSDYEDGPAEKHGQGAMTAWLKEKAAIDRFVVEGNGEWVERL